MKKKNQKGFALAETLIVSTVVAGILVYLFVQFSALKRSYNNSFSYNSVDDLYAIEDVFDYIDNLSSETRTNIISGINSQDYIEIVKNDNEFSDNVEEEQIVDDEYGFNLLNALDLKVLIITKEDISSIDFDSDNLKQGMKTFISKIKNTDGDNYRLIAQFENNTFATMIIPMEVD